MGKENKLLPKLRFSEFQDNWKIKELDSSIKLLSGYAFKGDEISETNNGIRLLRGINITEGRIRHNKDIDRYYNKTVVSLEKYLLQEDDLVLGMDGSKVGKNVSLISKEDAGSLLIQRVARIRAKDSTDIRFVYLNIFSERFHKYVDKVNTSSGIPHISSKQIKEFSIGFPSFLEQQKVASFLTDVDDKITKLTKKKTLLEQYKKGIMQKIFNQELSFKDDNGNTFPKWEVKKLADFKSLVHGDGDWILSKDIAKKGDYKIVQLGNIGFGIYVEKKLKTITSVKFIELKGTLINKGDLLINRMVDGALNCCILKKDGNYITSVDVCWIRQNDYFNNYFLMSLILFGENQNRLLNLSSGSGRVRISKKNLFNEFSFNLPSKEEQTKIANFLSDIDIKIEALNTKIEDSKTFKKGLLQKMFV
jgi:type I restriction enzyme S subunit